MNDELIISSCIREQQARERDNAAETESHTYCQKKPKTKQSRKQNILKVVETHLSDRFGSVLLDKAREKKNGGSEHTETSETNKHPHILTLHLGSITHVFVHCGRKLEHIEETHTYPEITESTKPLHVVLLEIKLI